MMKSIAITGGIGSGKSAVCSYLEEKGYTLIYADEIARAMTIPDGEAIEKIASTFGEEYILKDGSMDRNKIRQLVYSDKDAMDKLQSITTFATRAKISDILTEYADSGKFQLAFVEVPLLFELNAQSDYNYSWLVIADIETRINRIYYRDSLDRDAAINIMNAQLPDEYKIKLADEVIYNNSSIDSLHSKIDNLLAKYSL